MSRLAKETALVVATLLGLAVLWELRGPVLIFLLSLVVAAAARTPVDYLIGRGLPKSLALAGTYLVGLLLLAGIALAAVYLVSGELARATNDFQRLYHDAAARSSNVPWLKWIVADRLPPAEELLAALAHGGQAFRLVVGTAFGVVSTLVNLVFVVVLSIYWTIDRTYFERLWLSLLPLPQRVSARKLWRTLEAELGAYTRSEIAQSALAGMVLGAGFYGLGLDYPALLALVAALAWLVPWLGAIIAIVALAVAELPALILQRPGAMFSLVAAAAFTMVVFAILEAVVEPRLFNRRRYNSLLMVLAVLALAETFGILGLLLGPMAAVAMQSAVEHIERERIAASRPPIHLDALEARIADLRATTDAGKEFPQDWLSIVNRLAALTAQAREIVGEPGQEP